MTAESPSVTTQESPINVYIEPGYMPAWSYTHLFALPYVCDTITCYCLNPVRLHYETLKILGDPGKTGCTSGSHEEKPSGQVRGMGKFQDAAA